MMKVVRSAPASPKAARAPSSIAGDNVAPRYAAQPHRRDAVERTPAARLAQDLASTQEKASAHRAGDQECVTRGGSRGTRPARRSSHEVEIRSGAGEKSGRDAARKRARGASPSAPWRGRAALRRARESACPREADRAFLAAPLVHLDSRLFTTSLQRATSFLMMTANLGGAPRGLEAVTRQNLSASWTSALRSPPC